MNPSAPDALDRARETTPTPWRPGSTTRCGRSAADGRPTPNGWNSWTGSGSTGGLGTNIDETNMGENLAVMAREFEPYGIDYFQMDDGYQTADGDWQANQKFPSGMPAFSKKVSDTGLKPGLWIAPFRVSTSSTLAAQHPDWLLDPSTNVVQGFLDPGAGARMLDLSNPAVLDWLGQTMKRYKDDWGERWIKHDFGYYDMLYPPKHDPGITSIEAYKNGIRAIKAALGDDVFYLGIALLGINFGVVDGMRLTLDAGPLWEQKQPFSLLGSGDSFKSTVKTGARRYYFHNRLWVTHNDLLFFRTDKQHPDPPITMDEAKTYASFISLSGSIIKFGEDLRTLTPEQIDVWRQLLPSYPDAARPMDLFTRHYPEQWLLRVDGTLAGSDASWFVVGLLNWGRNFDFDARPIADMPDEARTYTRGLREVGHRPGQAVPGQRVLEREVPGRGGGPARAHYSRARPRGDRAARAHWAPAVPGRQPPDHAGWDRSRERELAREHARTRARVQGRRGVGGRGAVRVPLQGLRSRGLPARQCRWGRGHAAGSRRHAPHHAPKARRAGSARPLQVTDMDYSSHPFSLRQLQYAVAVAELLSFRKAAESCHVSQPSLSAQLAQLEDALGVRLFERDRRRVLVTEAGREIVERARRILRDTTDLVELARRAADPLAGTLRIGVIPTISPYLLPLATRALRSAYPRLTVHWIEEKTDTLVEQLDAGALDAALLALEADIGDVEHAVVGHDPFVLATPKGHPLGTKSTPARASELGGAGVLLLDDGHCFRDQAWAFCAGAEANELEFRATSLSTLAQMVAGGAGITLLPELAVPTEARRAELLPAPVRKARARADRRTGVAQTLAARPVVEGARSRRCARPIPHTRPVPTRHRQ